MTIALSILAIVAIYGMLVLFAWLERRRLLARASDFADAAVYWKLERKGAEKRGDLLTAERCAHQVEVYANLSLGYVGLAERPIWRLW